MSRQCAGIYENQPCNFSWIEFGQLTNMVLDDIVIVFKCSSAFVVIVLVVIIEGLPDEILQKKKKKNVSWEC
jgi:hypothetical protein